MLIVRADVVGSLLRPPDLLEARKGLLSGALSSQEFKAIEDGAVDRAIALQEAAGLEVVTDGEQRRISFQSQMTEAVEGFGEWDLDPGWQVGSQLPWLRNDHSVHAPHSSRN